MNNPPSPFADQPLSQPPARRRLHVIGLIAAVLVGGLLLGVLACGGVFYLGVYGISSRETSAEEKAGVVTIRDVAQLGEEVEREQREVWKTKRNLDGALEIEYEYDPDLAPGPGDHISVQSSLEIEHSERGAKESFSYNITGFKAGMRIFGVKTREQEHVMEGVDQTYFGLVTKDDKPVGNMVVIRKGKRIYSLLLIGLYFEEPRELEEIMREKIEQGEQVIEK